MFLLYSCSSLNSSKDQSENLRKNFEKICIESSGKGRIELAGTKFVFDYESAINQHLNTFEMGLEFPIIGEQKLTLNLNPREASREIGDSNIVQILNEKLGDQEGKKQTIKSVKEFFVFSSDFLRFRAKNIYPKHFVPKIESDHFLLIRETPHYIYTVDSYAANEKFYERVVLKLFLKEKSQSDPVMTLFLVPNQCAK